MCGTGRKWELWSMWRQWRTDVWKIWLFVDNYMPLIPFSPDNCVDPEKLRWTWWESFAMMVTVLHLQTLLRPDWYFNPVPTFQFWAVLVVWQHTLSCFASFYEGVWMVCKAVGADRHQRLYPWFPQQDSVGSWSILLTNWWHFGDSGWSVSAQLKLHPDRDTGLTAHCIPAQEGVQEALLHFLGYGFHDNMHVYVLCFLPVLKVILLPLSVRCVSIIMNTTTSLETWNVTIPLVLKWRTTSSTNTSPPSFWYTSQV